MKYIILGICILMLFLIVAYFMVSKKKFDKDVQEMIASAKRKLDGVVAEAKEKP